MAISRKQALKRLEGLQRELLEHLENHIPQLMHDNPESIPHWRHELGNWLQEMGELTKHVGRRTGLQWQAAIDQFRQRAMDLLGPGETLE